MRGYRGQIDLLAVYCPQIDKVYVVPEGDLPDFALSLRVDPVANGQARAIRWARTYELA